MKDRSCPSDTLDTNAILALLGFPDAAEFSLENSHFYLDDFRYPAFCVAMQRAHQQGLNGVTLGDVASALQSREPAARLLVVG